MSNTWNGLDLDRWGWSRWGCWVGGGKCLQSSSMYCMYVYFLVTLSVLTMSAQIGDLNVVICHDILVGSGCFDQKDWATLLWVGLSMRSAVSLCKQPSLVFTLGLVTRWLPFDHVDDKINVGTHTSGSCLCSDTSIVNTSVYSEQSEQSFVHNICVWSVDETPEFFSCWDLLLCCCRLWNASI